MKTITISDSKTINLDDVLESEAIFAYENDELIGMVVMEDHFGWIVRIGGDFGAYGYRETLKELIIDGMEKYNTTFKVKSGRR